MARDHAAPREELEVALEELGTAYVAAVERTARLEEELGTLHTPGSTASEDPDDAEARHHEWYGQVVERVREAVAAHLPRYARVAVVTKGDDRLLDFEGVEGWHFPRTETGQYAGHYPETGEEAVAHLEELRTKGAEFFVLPASGVWWLDHYPELREHLDSHFEPLLNDRETCVIYDLRDAPMAATTDGPSFETVGVGRQAGGWIDALLPSGSGVALAGAAAAHAELPDRDVRRVVGTEERGVTAEELRQEVASATAQGIRYAAVISPPSRPGSGERGRLRAALMDAGRPVARQALAEVFELDPCAPRELCEAVAPAIPPGSTVYVVSKGDDQLLALGDCNARHFPPGPDGGYAWYHPADSGHAVQLLEEARSAGGEYLLIPAASLWWLDHYPAFADRLREGRKVVDAPCGVAFELATRRRWRRLLRRPHEQT